jgi:DNA-binding MarR family transcriptional regulator
MEQEGVVALLRTAEVVRRSLTAAIAPVGLTLQQYNVLRILRGAGPAGLPTLDVADRMIEHAPGITRMMDRLEAEGWVTRERCPTDRREVHCRITAVGLGLLARLDGTIDEADRRALGSLEETKLRKLIALLDEIRASHSAEPGAPTDGTGARQGARRRSTTTLSGGQ